ncbi:GDP GTP exchange factor protein [Rutstroemia sp. NJR-2017a BVV2]|nr:GDP GTP exchange factor protein [Rutstroemia sp. NJR-2017a BVV2]
MPWNIFQGIFPIHPIPNHRPFLGHGSYTGSCVICGHKYSIAEKLARLHCDHYFHFSCIRKYWDSAGDLSYACPSCKKKPSPQSDKATETEKELSNLAANAKRTVEEAAKRDFTRTVGFGEVARCRFETDLKSQGPPDQSIDRSTNMARTKASRDTKLQGKVKDNQPVQSHAREEEKAALRSQRSSIVDRNMDKDGAKKATDEPRNDTGVKKVSVFLTSEPAPTKKRARGDDEVLPDTKKAKVDLPLNPPPMERLDVYVCGSGDSGELGLGAKPFDGKKPLGVQRPRYNHLLKGITQIGVGGMHCIALTDDQKVLTWGVNDDGALARNTTWESAPTKDADADSNSVEEEMDLNPLESTPTAISTAFLGTKRAAQVVASDSASFILTDDGMVYGWGTFRGNEGLIGFTSQGAAQAAVTKDDDSKKKYQIQLEPILIPGLKNIKSLARGSNHVLALDNKGNVFSWGSWQQCQIGRRPPVRPPFSGLIPAPFMKKIKYIAAGTYHSFAIDTHDRVWAWGLNNFGQTGITSNAGQDGAIINVPTQVKSLSNYKIKQIKGGVHHTIACTEDGQVLIWGRCHDDQAGMDLSTLPQDDMIFSQGKPGILTKPTVVPGISATVVAAGIDNSMVVSKEGTVYAWGFSASFRTGLGTVNSVTRPTLVENSAVKGKRMTFVGCGGQFGVLAGPENR